MSLSCNYTNNHHVHKRQQHTTVIHYINAIIIYSDCTFSAEEGPGTDNSLLHLFWIVPTSTGTHANAVHLTGVRPLQASQPETSESLRSRCTGPIGPIRNPCLASTNFSLQLELFTLHLASAWHCTDTTIRLRACGCNTHLSNTATSGVSASQKLLYISQFYMHALANV